MTARQPVSTMKHDPWKQPSCGKDPALATRRKLKKTPVLLFRAQPAETTICAQCCCCCRTPTVLVEIDWLFIQKQPDKGKLKPAVPLFWGKKKQQMLLSARQKK